MRSATPTFPTSFGNPRWNTLEQNFSKPVFEMWIKPMRFVEYRGGRTAPRGPQQICAGVGRHQAPGADHRGPQRDLRLGARATALGRRARASRPRTMQVPSTPALRPRICAAPISTCATRFEEFVVGNSNRFAHAAAQAVASAPARPTTRSSSTAASGLGKTHLMHAIGHRVMIDNPERQRRLRLEREVHQRIHHRDQEQPERPSFATATGTSTCC